LPTYARSWHGRRGHEQRRQIPLASAPACREALAICDHDPSALLFLAFNGVNLVHERVPVKGGGDPEQAAVDRLAAFFAIAELLGVPLAEALL
jgi:hypothetical protein